MGQAGGWRMRARAWKRCFAPWPWRPGRLCWALPEAPGASLEREASRRQVGKPDTCRPHVSLTCSGLHALSSMRRGRAPSPLADTVGDFSVPSPLVFHYGRTPGRLGSTVKTPQLWKLMVVGPRFWSSALHRGWALPFTSNIGDFCLDSCFLTSWTATQPQF